MALPINSHQIFDLLAADSALMALLGVHRLRNGTTRPALAHLWPHEAIEATSEPAGVEIIVYRSAMGSATQLTETGQIVPNLTFKLAVTQWVPLSGGYNQSAVINRLFQLLPGANASDVTIDNLTAGLQQHIITWQCVAAVILP
jgi:hypothetical protein